MKNVLKAILITIFLFVLVAIIIASAIYKPMNILILTVVTLFIVIATYIYEYLEKQ